MTLEEQTFKLAGSVIRPFSEAVGVQCRGYSLPFQRLVTDFGAEKSFERAALQVKEHYRLDIAASTVRRITEGHGARVLDDPELTQGSPNEGGSAKQLIAQTDGTMVAVVTTASDGEGDQRKTRQVA